MSGFRMTPVYDVLLRGSESVPFGLYDLHLASCEQLTRLHYSPNSFKMVQKRLKALVDNGYVQFDKVPTKQFKSPYYYVLGLEGVKYLARIGIDVREAWRAASEIDKNYLFLEHTLEVNDMLIAAALIHQADPRFALRTMEHERAMKRHPFKVSHEGRHFTIIPDAFLEFRYTLAGGHQRRAVVLLEHDRATEEQAHFRRRIRGYITLLKSEAFQSRYNARTVTVTFTTFAGQRRLAQMRQWTMDELHSTSESQEIGAVFAFTTLPKPPTPQQAWLEPNWYLADTAAQGQVLLAT